MCRRTPSGHERSYHGWQPGHAWQQVTAPMHVGTLSHGTPQIETSTIIGGYLSVSSAVPSAAMLNDGVVSSGSITTRCAVFDLQQTANDPSSRTFCSSSRELDIGQT